MRFFQRLAPVARTRHAVQPALPPRFAGAAGLQEIDPEVPTMPVRPAPSVEPTEQQEAPPETPRSAPRETMPARDTRMPLQAIEAQVGPLPVQQSAGQPSSDVPMRPLAAPVPHVVHVHEPAIASQPRSEAAPPRSPRDDARDPPQGPLSSIALAQRLQPGNGDAPVVHVTIDRIEVRAPAPAAAPRARAKPRQTPTMSLSDYLRRGR